MNSTKRHNIGKNINFTYIPETKFKTTTISVLIFTSLEEKYASQNALIPKLLAHSCKKYPSLLSISKKLEELYGASVSPGVGNLGDSQVITLSINCLNNSFIPDGSDNILESATLLCDMIFNPDISNNAFKIENIETEKRQLIEEIESQISDKKLYSRKKCVEIMCKDEPYGIDPLGNIENAKKLNEKNVFEAWQRLLQSAKIEIIMTGGGTYESVMEEFKKRFSEIERKDIFSCENKIIKKASHIKEAKEIMDVVQCKLVMGFRTEIAKPSEDVEAVKVMNALLGGTAQSKLFLNVREKLSLCYYCSSRYVAQKGIIFIESGVQKENVSKAKEEILKQIKDIQLGNFTDKELDETKLFLSQSLEKIKDSPGSLSSWYGAQAFDEVKQSPEECIEKINNVSREKVISAAKKITTDTIYLLSGKEIQ